MQLDGVLAMRLEDCATSTRLGMADKGFPQALGRLAAMGYVTAAGGGYKITKEGHAALQEIAKYRHTTAFEP
jgi:Mn-dependent DtxR family transcriptional regulator